MREKEQIRDKIRQWRKLLLRDFRKEVNSAVIEHLVQIQELRQAKTIMAYKAIEHNGEISVDGLEVEFEALFVYPKVVSRTEMITMIPEEGWKESKLGIEEPVGTEFKEQPDVCLIPMLAADERGNRLGYGAGYYDRFLGHENGLKIGICYDEWLLKSLPSESFDVPVDILVTEKQTMRIG